MDEASRPGATLAEWEALRSAPFSGWVLPTTCGGVVRPAPRSGLTVGEAAKVPSMVRPDGVTFSGIPGWTTRAAATAEELSAWSRRPEHGACVRTGHDGLYAVDCDVEDEEESALVFRLLLGVAGVDGLPVRRRGDGPRWAALLRESGTAEAVGKRIVRLAGGAVELLGAGNHLAVAGTHPSGQRYRWERRTEGGSAPCLPEALEVPCGTVDRLVDALRSLSPADVVSDRAASRAKSAGYAASDGLADWLESSGRVTSRGRGGELFLRCPWAHEHVEGGDLDKPRDAVYFPAGSNGYPTGGFRCLHAHSGSATPGPRTVAMLREWARREGWRGETGGDVFPDESAAVAADEEEARAALAQWQADDGRYVATMDSVTTALEHVAACGVRVAADRFTGAVMVSAPGKGEPWRIRDVDYGETRIRLERFGFKAKSLGKDLVRDAVLVVSERRAYDSMADFLAGWIPAWDGVERWGTFFQTYCGGRGGDYEAAVGRYLASAMYGRATCRSPGGIKADVAVVLVGDQGMRKSTLVRALAIDSAWFAEVKLDASDDQIALQALGKVVVEIPELVGMGRREVTAMKSFLSAQADDVRKVYRENFERFPRRFVAVMTTNEWEFLTDATGNRRYAPVEVGLIDVEGVVRDLPQLWAEGRELFRRHGIMQAEVERLSAQSTESHAVCDPWDEAIAEWLPSAEDAMVPLTTRNILDQALKKPMAQLNGLDAQKVGRCMGRLGYVSVREAFGGVRTKVWRKK